MSIHGRRGTRRRRIVGRNHGARPRRRHGGRGRLSADQPDHRAQRLLVVLGGNTFIITLLPLIAGVGLLFFGGRPRLAKALILVGAILVFVAAVSNMRVQFRPTTLFATLVMLFLLVAGIGLLLRGLRPSRDS